MTFPANKIPIRKYCIFQMITDDSSSANESSSSEKPKDFKKSKRPPPPPIVSKSPSKSTETEVKKVPESADSEINDNNNLLGLVNCAVCGKQFGKNSIKFHLRQCQKKQQLMKGRQEKIEESTKQQTEEEEGKSFIFHFSIRLTFLIFQNLFLTSMKLFGKLTSSN